MILGTGDSKFTALPFDMRNGCAFPGGLKYLFGLCPDFCSTKRVRCWDSYTVRA
jgi:hypothetical protein